MNTDQIEPATETTEQLIAKRIADCGEEIKLALAKYGCSLDAAVIVTSKGNIPQVQVVAN